MTNTTGNPKAAPTPMEVAISLLCGTLQETAGQEPAAPAMPPEVVSIAREGGYIREDLIRDLLQAPGIDLFIWQDLMLLAGIPLDTVYIPPAPGCPDPWSTDAEEHVVFRGLTLTDFTALLVYAERWALPIDPQPFVTAVLPSLIGKRLLNRHERAVFWWALEIHRSDIIRFPADLSDESCDYLLRTGYRFCSGPLGLSIASPKITDEEWDAELTRHGLGYPSVALVPAAAA